LIPAAFGILLGTGIGSHVGSAHGGRITVAAGTLVSAAGLLMQAQLADGGSYGPTGFGLLLFGLGAGIAMPAATDSVMSAVPVSRSGVGSAVNDTTREVGAALGVAVVGSVAASAYTTAMREQAAVPGLPDALREAVNDNIGAAVAAGGQLGAEGAALVAAAQDAFVTSMSSALWVAAAVALWGTVIAVVHLPRHAATAGTHLRPARRS
jgi:hypothetical protein